MNKTTFIFLNFWVFTILIACTPTGSSESGGTQLTVTQPSAENLPSKTSETKKVNPIETNNIPPDLMSKITDKVVSLSGMNREEIVVVRAEQVTWPDGSLGCPQPDMGYTQALVEGYWIILRAGKEEYDYRASATGGFTRCQGATKQAPIRYDDDT